LTEDVTQNNALILTDDLLFPQIGEAINNIVKETCVNLFSRTISEVKILPYKSTKNEVKGYFSHLFLHDKKVH